MPGEIVKVTGPLSYQVRVESGIVHRHVDNIRPRYSDDYTALQSELLNETDDDLSTSGEQLSPTPDPETTPTGTLWLFPVILLDIVLPLTIMAIKLRRVL